MASHSCRHFLCTDAGDGRRPLRLTHRRIETALNLELSDGTVIADTVDGTVCVFLGGLYGAEQANAERLHRLVSGPLPWAYIDPEKALPWIERKTRFGAC